MLQRSILCMQGTQYAPPGSILCRGAFCGSTGLLPDLSMAASWSQDQEVSEYDQEIQQSYTPD